ncbi:MAG TPA: hypothetical protein VGM92_14010 [Candidatus Kapabacteria bacterium]|jgi:hypothetical protein
MRSAWLCFALICTSRLCAQTPSDSALDVAELHAESAISLPIGLLVPEGIQLGYAMRSFIRSVAFGAYETQVTPDKAFDEIYFESMALAHGNRSIAFLAASFGCFEHEWIPLKFFGSELDIPLTSENHARFLQRLGHLPTHLYRTSEDDRDKLQHFFASAWLKSIFGMNWLVHLAGHTVESGEDLFVIGGSIDPRDLHANNDGLHFELRSEEDPEAFPSQALTPNP